VLHQSYPRFIIYRVRASLCRQCYLFGTASKSEIHACPVPPWIMSSRIRITAWTQGKGEWNLKRLVVLLVYICNSTPSPLDVCGCVCNHFPCLPLGFVAFLPAFVLNLFSGSQNSSCPRQQYHLLTWRPRCVVISYVYTHGRFSCRLGVLVSSAFVTQIATGDVRKIKVA